MTIIHQEIGMPPAPEQKALKPLTTVKRGIVTLGDVYSWSINRSRDAMVTSFNLDFIGQDQFLYTDPDSLSPTEFSIFSGYNVGGVENLKELISGYSEDQSQSIQSRQLTTNVKFFDCMRELMSPRSEKVLIDIFRENQGTSEDWEVGDDLEDKLGITSVSELMSFILSGYGISLRYMSYDYRIAYYRKEDYPLNIIKDLAEFIGAYLRYNSEQNTLEVLDKHPSSFGYYDFLYKDAGDILDLGRSGRSVEFYNAIQVYGTIPDNYPEYDKDEEIGIGLEEDNDLHLVDTIKGVERAPSDPYRAEIPEDLIEKKFFNVFLGFEIDPASVEVKGGSWDEEKQEYTGAVFLAYGGLVPSDQVIIEDVNDPYVDPVNPVSMPPGEGLVGFPWNYEENTDKDSQKDYNMEDNVFRTVGITGQVINELDDVGIEGAQVELDFLYENNIWQYWKYSYTGADGSASNAVFLFYLPSGSVELGDGWEDVTSEYPELDDPVGFPKSTLTASGDDTGEEGGKGVFMFNNMPLSDYEATATAIGFNENSIDITFTADNFNFLNGSGSDNNQKYKLVDTPYSVAIYAKKANPIVFGADELYNEDAKIYPSRNIRIEVRHRRGIDLAGGKLHYAPAITDSRVLSKDIAVRAGGAVLIDSLSKRKSLSVELNHNPWLREGMRIAIESYAKGWTSSSLKVVTVDSVDQNWNVSGGREGIFDQVQGVEYL